MKRFVCSLAALLALAAPLFAIYDWQPLQKNNFMMAITNYGRLGQTIGGSDAYAFWPAPAIDTNGMLIPPLMNYIYGWGLWVGAKVPSLTIPGKTDTSVTMGYNCNNGNYEYVPGAVLGGMPEDKLSINARIYMSTEPSWPLKKVSGQDSIISMCDTRCVYNDWLASQHEAGGRPLKLEVTQTTYQWNALDLRDMIFFLWEVKNTGTDTLTDVFLAPAADCDIGNEGGSNANDVCHYDTTTDMGYQYQTNPNESGWSRQAGSIGFSIIRGPAATKDYTFPDGHQLHAGDTIGLSCFKIMNINNHPQTDIDQYLDLAGYNFKDSTFYRLDSTPNPGDQRFIASTGPIDIPPGQTASLLVAVACAGFDYNQMGIDDTLAIDTLRQKVLLARMALTNQIPFAVISPSGGEVWSGSHSITWTYGGSAQPTDSIDIFYSRDGSTWDTVAINLPNSGACAWSTASVPDGMRCRLMLFLHGPKRLAIGQSNWFTIDNPVNGSPELALVYPDSQVIAGVHQWKWCAGDADGDQLFFNLFVQREGNGYWTKVAGPISSDTCNTRFWRQYQYAWDTDTMLNENYRLMVNAYDGSELVKDSAVYYYQIDNPYTTHETSLSSGHCNLPFYWYVLNQAYLTGHVYEARFKPIARGSYTPYGLYSAEYKYDLWDATTASLLWNDRIIPYFDGPTLSYYDPGDLIDGFVPTCGDTGFKPRLANMDSIIRPTWDISPDTLKGEHITNPTDFGWACLNTPMEIHWHVNGTTPNDTLQAEVWDVAYNVQIPLDTTRLNDLSTISWMFGGTGTGVGRSIITTGTSAVTRMYMNLCGYRLYYNRGSTVTRQMTWATHPQEGDVWKLYFSGDVPPRLDDVFSFTPTGVASGPNFPAVGCFFLSQNAPNPFYQHTNINYQISKPGQVSLKVYNIAGQLVRTVVDARQPAGSYSVRWDGRDQAGRSVAAGVYLYRLKAGDKALTRKMVLVR